MSGYPALHLHVLCDAHSRRREPKAPGEDAPRAREVMHVALPLPKVEKAQVAILARGKASACWLCDDRLLGRAVGRDLVAGMVRGEGRVSARRGCATIISSWVEVDGRGGEVTG